MKKDVIITEKNILCQAWIGDLNVLVSDFADKVKDENGWTPLHIMAMNGIKEIVDHKSSHLIKDKHGRTPLHLLANRGDVSVLSNPRHNKVTDNNGWSCLHYLAWHKRKEIFSYLETEFHKDKFGDTPAYIFATQVEFNVNDYTEDELRINKNTTILHLLAEYDKKSILSHPLVGLLKDKQKRSALHILAGRGIHEVLSFETHLSDEDEDGYTILHHLVSSKLSQIELKNIFAKYFQWYYISKESRISIETVNSLLKSKPSDIFINII